ncbi:hypothetical protein [uncultured Celeribacter sp.]|uniref:hypothetical protein n=1 Tax=uncultured Celeribacter sp. TaxID=1303376 RepID=UPI002AA840EB|nr:hypothetical protein [uncultured Celeribacter sp.]
MIVVTLRRLFAPLTLAFESRSAAMVLLEDLGWTPEESFQLDAFEHLAPVQEKLTALMAVIEAYDPDDPDVGSIVEQAVLLAGDINAAISALSEMSAGDVTNLVSPLNSPVFWQELALDLPDYLILTYLRLYMGPLYALLAFGGAIVDEARPNGRPPRQVIDWEALGRLLRDPAGQIRAFYDWGGTLEHVRLMTRLGDVLRALGLPVFERDIPAPI